MGFRVLLHFQLISAATGIFKALTFLTGMCLEINIFESKLELLFKTKQFILYQNVKFFFY